MGNFTTTTINNVSISNRRFVEIDNYHTCETINSVTNIKKYLSFIKSFKTTLANFELLNEDEILNFIFHNAELLELIKNVKPILNEHFPNYDYALEFNSDPEIPQFNQLVLYVKGDVNSFDKDWDEVKKVNKEIRELSLNNKSFFTVDLW